MRLFKRWAYERGTPEVSKQFLQDTKARDEEIARLVGKNSRKVTENHLGPKMHKALRGY